MIRVLVRYSSTRDSQQELVKNKKTQLEEHMYTLAHGTSHKKGQVLSLHFLQAIYSMYITNNIIVTIINNLNMCYTLIIH